MWLLEFIEILLRTLIPSALISIAVYTAFVIAAGHGTLEVENHYGGWTYAWMEGVGILTSIFMVVWATTIICYYIFSRMKL